jgi:hypothetical protein
MQSLGSSPTAHSVAHKHAHSPAEVRVLAILLPQFLSKGIQRVFLMCKKFPTRFQLLAWLLVGIAIRCPTHHRCPRVCAMASAATTTEAVYKQQLAEGRSEAYAQVTPRGARHFEH